MRPVEINSLSRYRSALMGVAMISVMLFHVSLPRNHALFGLVKCGNIGVDMFLFLSGIGLWFSWTKNPANNWRSTLNFYWRRYVRIYPAWFLMALLFYVPNYLTVRGGGYSPNLFHLIANITINWSFWRIDDLSFWFIPAIMMLYTFAPAYMQLIRRKSSWRWLPVVFMLWYALVRYYPPLWQSIGHVEIFWSRIPIFLLGINCGQWVKEQRTLDGSAPWMLLLTFALSLTLCVIFEQSRRGAFPPFAERMAYIPLSVSALLLLGLLFRHSPAWLLKAFSFVGSVSLELYLIHVEFVLKHIRPYHLSFWPTALLMIAISLPLAYLLNKAVSLLVKRLPKNILP